MTVDHQIQGDHRNQDASWLNLFLPKVLLRFFSEMGLLFLIIGDTLKMIARGRIDWRKTIVQTAAIGFDSLPMVMLICLIVGSVLALQTSEKFAQTGADSYVGGLVALAIVRELAPIFVCLAVGTRAGTAIAAEIANMQVTEQIDALRMMHVDPVRYLVVPRLLACVIALPLLTFLGEIVGVLGGMIVAQAVSQLHYNIFLESIWLNLKQYDIFAGLFKALIFGVILASISCMVGLSARGGAKDVGQSTTRAVVRIAITIIITDFILTWLLFGTSFDQSH